MILRWGQKNTPATIYHVLACALMLWTLGCEPPGELSSEGGIQWDADSATDVLSEDQPDAAAGRVIVSDGPITIENGKVTYGRPEVTEEVERQIHKTLSYYRNLAEAIERKVPGGNRGRRQTREDYETSAKIFMAKYGISRSEINAIVKKGDDQGW